jgi:hypothetical protein
MYEVVLKKQSTVSSNQFKYNYFAILGNIQMNISNGDYVDVARSVQCSPGWNAAELNIQSTGEVAFLLGDQSQSGEPSAGQSITFVNGSALLFRVIVHTSPGSQINWQNPTPNPVNPYLWVYGKNTSGVNTYECMAY